MPQTAPDAVEQALQSFLEQWPAESRSAASTLAHTWKLLGGHLAPGAKVARLLAGEPAFTVATLKGPGTLELSRAILAHHGVSDDQWIHWCDELAELAAHGLDPAAKFPAVELANLSPGQLARLATGLRDLWNLLHG